jgi:hypothetical protein
MDLCSLEDAFPNIDTGSIHKAMTNSSGFPFVGGIDAKPSKEERRAARKKAKKMKGPALAYSDSTMPDLPPTGSDPDPDRPAVRRMEPVASVQAQKDGFAIPVLPKASCLFSDAGTPSYFGKGLDDTEEGFSSFSTVEGDNPNYMLQPDVTKTFDLKAVEKAAGKLPEPNLSDTWKPMSSGGTYTAYTHVGDKAEPTWSMNSEKPIRPVPEEEHGEVKRGGNDAKDATKEMLMNRVNDLVGRLETLEKKRSQDSQTEILMFVGTGVFLLLSFELLTR